MSQQTQQTQETPATLRYGDQDVPVTALAAIQTLVAALDTRVQAWRDTYLANIAPEDYRALMDLVMWDDDGPSHARNACHDALWYIMDVMREAFGWPLATTIMLVTTARELTIRDALAQNWQARYQRPLPPVPPTPSGRPHPPQRPLTPRQLALAEHYARQLLIDPRPLWSDCRAAWNAQCPLDWRYDAGASTSGFVHASRNTLQRLSSIVTR